MASVSPLGQLVRRPRVIYGLRPLHGRIYVAAVAMLLLTFPFSTWWSQLLNLSIWVGLDIFLRWYTPDSSLMGYVANMWVLAFGHHLDIGPLEWSQIEPRGQREFEIAEKTGTFVIAVHADKGKIYWRIYFLRRRDLVMFRLRI